MNPNRIFVTLLALGTLAGCAGSSADPEAVASTDDALRLVCGPVLFTGEGIDERQKLALHIAEKEARQTCRTTPAYCAVDCDAAPIKDSSCTPSAVTGDDGSVAVTWTCEVTISASAPTKKACDVAVRCAPGYHGVDTDGDGCYDSCQPD